MKVTFGGSPVELAGTEIHVGDTIADFTAVKNVCDAEVRKFNVEATKMPDVTVIVVSMDLPFAQARWCGAAGVDRVLTVSDHKDRNFAHTFGAYLPNVGLIARSVFLLDSNNTVKYVEYVPEVTHHPNYEAALAAVRA